jgi:hypothetical protein
MATKIFSNGINFSTGELLTPPLDEQFFGKNIQQSLLTNSGEVRSMSKASFEAKSFRGEIERKIVDVGDPKSAGWTFLLNEKDPGFSEIIEVISPLAKLREMENPRSPLIFNSEPEDEWQNWLQENYSSLILSGKKAPHYVLIIGDPNQVPFKFQSIFGSVASVGRLSFDSVEELHIYVQKIIRLEDSSEPNTSKEAIVFAPDWGMQDPTYFSCQYMAKPIAEHMNNDLGFKTNTLLGNKATKKNLLDSLRDVNPSLVYSASHGVGAPNEPFEVQKRFNGSICCQKVAGTQLIENLFTAADVPSDDKPFLEGSIFFQFACFGYGTPAQSDFSHWVNGNSELNSKIDFISALPKSLLAHPKGPIAYIGHIDTAWLHGFDDPKNPYIIEKWSPRIAPFLFAIDTLLQDANPVGPAMAEMNERFNICNAVLTSALDRLQRNKTTMSPEFFGRLSDTFISRSDAQNYLIFGDPAARPRIKTR